MGCAASSAEDASSKAIDRTLREAARRQERELKLLLLGSGESGKSTVAKQMRLIFLNGFTEDEMQRFSPIIRMNLISVLHRPLVASLLGVDKAVGSFDASIFDQDGQIGTEWGELRPLALKWANPARMTQFRMADEYDESIRDEWKQLAASPVFKEMVQRGDEYGLIDSAPYFLDRLDEILSPSYVPCTMDVLRMRVTTTSIQEISFLHEDYAFRVVDVGGQRNERRKWIHCFDNVTAIIFIVACHEYDLMLREDTHVNRMHESLKLFDDMINCEFFQKTPFILFLNKTDLLKDKLAKGITPDTIFPDYSCGKNPEKCILFLKKKFLALSKRPNNNDVFAYPTCALDTGQIDFVFKTVRSVLLQDSLQQI